MKLASRQTKPPCVRASAADQGASGQPPRLFLLQKLDRAAPKRPTPTPWRTEGSVLIGLDLVRSVMGRDGGFKEQAHAKVVGWLSAAGSDFEDTRGNPAPLYRIKYLDGALAGDEEDLEEYDLGVLLRRGAFTSLDGLVSIRRGRGWSLFRTASSDRDAPRRYEVRNSVPDADRRALAEREGVPYVEPTKKRKVAPPKKPAAKKKKRGGAIAATKAAPRPKKKKKRESSVVVQREEAPRPLRRAAAQAALNRGFADGMMASAHRGRDEVVRIGLARRALQELTVETGAPKVNRRDVTKKCRELAGKLSRGDVTHETAKDLSDDDGYLHSDDEGITDLPLASSLVEHALDALVEQGEVKKSGDDYALVVDDDGDWFDSGVPSEAPSARRRRGDVASMASRVTRTAAMPCRRDAVAAAA